jgi:hypothetical protein
MARRHVPFSERHAPFDKKKRGAMYCRCTLFHFYKRNESPEEIWIKLAIVLKISKSS